jgi:hypothetical protein
MLRMAGGILLMAVLLGAGPGVTQSAAGWPTDDWKRSTPEAQAVDVEPLAALDAEFQAGKHGYIDSMLVIRNGSIIFENTYKQASAVSTTTTTPSGIPTTKGGLSTPCSRYRRASPRH